MSGIKKKKTVNKNNKDYIYATVIFRLTKDILTLSFSTSVNYKRQKAISRRSVETVGKGIWHFKIPDFELADVKMPCLEPLTELGELRTAANCTIRQAQEVGGGPDQPEGGQREKKVAGVPRKQSEVNDTFVLSGCC